MADKNRPTYCVQCSSIVHAKDRFCGVCGGEIPPDAQDAAPTEEIPSQIRVPRRIPARSNSRMRIFAVVIGALLVLLTGTVAYAAFGPGTELLGWSGSQPSDAKEATSAQEDPTEKTSPVSPSTTASVSPDSPPDPAFDNLLPTLRQRTKVPIMLPSELPGKLRNVAVDAGLSGNEYGVLFLSNPSDRVTKHYGHSEDRGTLKGSPKSEEKASEYFEATEVETVGLPDGTEATLRYMEPVREGGNYGPYWEGKFEERGYVYTLSVPLDEPSGDTARQVLSSIVLVSEPPEDDGGASDDERTAVEDAIRGHYKAIGSENFEQAYSYFGPTYRGTTDRESWINDEEAYQIEGANVNSLEVTNVSGNTATADVDVSFEDNTGTPRFSITWKLVKEGGRWKLDEQHSAEKLAA